MDQVKTLHGALALIWRRGANGTLEMLLQHRDEHALSDPDCYALWGGEIECGETPQRALVRELWEELGITVSVDRLGLLNRFDRIRNDRHGRYRWIGHVYVLEDHDGQLCRLREVREGNGKAWIELGTHLTYPISAMAIEVIGFWVAMMHGPVLDMSNEALK